MSKLETIDYNLESGEVIKREFTPDEVKSYEAANLISDAKNKAEADKAAAKQSAQAKLFALGLTEEEVASILG